MTTISILGCGWFGMALAKTLLEKGYHVKGSTTRDERLDLLAESGIKAYKVDFSLEEQVYDTGFFNCEVLFIAIPPKRKAGEASSYPKKIKSIIRQAIEHNIKQVVLISSTGVYENASCEFTELDIPNSDTDSGKALLLAENIARSQKLMPTTILRFGGLFGPGRNAGQFFAGKKDISNGLAPVNLIHLNDCIGISLSILEKQAFGYIYNACSDQHPSRADFYTRLAKEQGLELPEFIPELLDWKIINSINVPKILNYKFKEDLQ